VVCLDNFATATGKRENISTIIDNPYYILIEGDIRNLETCHKAAKGVNCFFYETEFLEEIAFDKKYISRDQLSELATPLSKNEYGEYLMKIVDKK